MVDFKPYTSKTNEVMAGRITAENAAEVYRFLNGNPSYSFNSVEGCIVKEGKRVDFGDYIVQRVQGDKEYFTEVDGMFKMNYCPSWISEEDKKIWRCASTLVKRRSDTAEEAIEQTKTLLKMR